MFRATLPKLISEEVKMSSGTIKLEYCTWKNITYVLRVSCAIKFEMIQYNDAYCNKVIQNIENNNFISISCVKPGNGCNTSQLTNATKI